MQSSSNGEQAQKSGDGHKALCQDQVDSFWRNGFLSIGKVLIEDEIELLRDEYDRTFVEAQAGKVQFRNLAIDNTDDLEKKNQAPQKMLQIMQMCELNMHFRRLLYDGRFLDIVEDLIGPNIQLFHDQALFKPAQHGGPVHLHQDNAYWRCTPANLVSIWLTLDDVDVNNGAMQFIPGSHLQAISHEQSQSTNALLDSSGHVAENEVVVANLPAGGIALHHCQTLHKTAPNTTDRQRRALAIHYMTPGTRSLRSGEYLSVSFSRPILRMRS